MIEERDELTKELRSAEDVYKENIERLKRELKQKKFDLQLFQVRSMCLSIICNVIFHTITSLLFENCLNFQPAQKSQNMVSCLGVGEHGDVSAHYKYTLLVRLSFGAQHQAFDLEP